MYTTWAEDAETIRKSTSTANNRLASILSRQQVKRLGEVERWVLGMKGLLRDSEATSLKLRDNQRKRIRSTIEETQKRVEMVQWLL